MIRGVNLGGWLILERWITPSLFEGLRAKDEYSFCYELGDDAATILKLHRDNFIAENDFKWISENGLNGIRIPVGYWVLGYSEPYIGAFEHLDKAMEWAEKYKLFVVVDLHGAPGSQNGREHSGKIGDVNWSSGSNIENSLKVVEQLAKRYKDFSCLSGISLLNEPSARISRRILKKYYQDGYEAVRRHCDENVAVIFSDAYTPKRWGSVLRGSVYRNTLIDMHLYQLFTSQDKKTNMRGHLRKTLETWPKIIKNVQKGHPAVIGEWSLALDPESMEGLSDSERIAATRSYAAAQLLTFEQAAGWFYWTYRVENKGNWDYRSCVERGLLPTSYETGKN